MEEEDQEQEITLTSEAITYSTTSAVDSVNGYTGTVVLTTSDLENTSDYQTGDDVDSAISTAIADKQDTLTAGDNITIEDNVISATDTTYTAGDGLTLTDTEFSVDTSTVATQDDLTTGLAAKQDVLTAGDNITISDNTISATDTTYTAGDGLVLTDTEFSADTSVLATQTDLASKQDALTAGDNITISDNIISATDTTYSDFTGTDGTTDGEAGLVPAPTTADADMFLKSDGTWAEAGDSVTLYDSTGTNTDGAMTQYATTNMVYRNNTGAVRMVGPGVADNYLTNPNAGGVLIGSNAKNYSGSYDVVIGGNAGDEENISPGYMISLGSYSKATVKGQMDISTLATTNTYGYNNSQYRLLSGLYDPQSDHDAATKGYVDGLVGDIESALNTINNGSES